MLPTFLGALPPKGAQAASSCTLRVTLYNEPFTKANKLKPIPLTFEAWFGVWARVLQVVRGSCPFKPGEKLAFVIHSPSLTFGGYWYDGKDFFLTLQKSDEKTTGRKWDLVGVDWPLSTKFPNFLALVCGAGDYAVRALLGPKGESFSSLTVFRQGVPLASLSLLDVGRAHPKLGSHRYELHYRGDPSSPVPKPALDFTANKKAGKLIIDGKETSLRCSWRKGE